MKLQRPWLGRIAAASLFFTPVACLAKPPTCMPVPPGKIGAQLYTFATLLAAPSAKAGTAESAQLAAQRRLDRTFGAVRGAGFRYLELFGGTRGLSQGFYRTTARKHGIAMIAGHDDLGPAAWSAALDTAERLGQRFVGSGEFGKPGFATLAETLATADNLDRLGRAAAAKGLRFYVHNHSGEFETRHLYKADANRQPKLTSAWEIIAANTDPRYVSFEVDIYWAWRALGRERFRDLLSFLAKYRSRIALLHVKDTAEDGSIADLGRGITDWPAVFKAAGPGIRYYIFEYDNPPDPIRSAKIGYDYLRCRTGATS
jgi:sugar phosphate isomerase/epimerase